MIGKLLFVFFKSIVVIAFVKPSIQTGTCDLWSSEAERVMLCSMLY